MVADDLTMHATIERVFEPAYGTGYRLKVTGTDFRFTMTPEQFESLVWECHRLLLETPVAYCRTGSCKSHDSPLYTQEQATQHMTWHQDQGEMLFDLYYP